MNRGMNKSISKNVKSEWMNEKISQVIKIWVNLSNNGWISKLIQERTITLWNQNWML